MCVGYCARALACVCTRQLSTGTTSIVGTGPFQGLCGAGVCVRAVQCVGCAMEAVGSRRRRSNEGGGGTTPFPENRIHGLVALTWGTVPFPENLRYLFYFFFFVFSSKSQRISLFFELRNTRISAMTTEISFHEELETVNGFTSKQRVMVEFRF